MCARCLQSRVNFNLNGPEFLSKGVNCFLHIRSKTSFLWKMHKLFVQNASTFALIKNCWALCIELQT